jgi:hypothetical protein
MAWHTTVDSHVSHDVEHDQNMMYMPEHDIDEAHVSEHDVYAPPISHEARELFTSIVCLLLRRLG